CGAHDMRRIVVAVAREVADLDHGIGERRLDQRFDLSRGHRHGAYDSLISWRLASTAFSSSTRRTSASSTSQPALVRSPKTLRMTSSSPASSKSAWTTSLAYASVSSGVRPI